MTAPWAYRPSGPDELDWEDNAVSNSIAWLSQQIVPTWCSDENHWTVKFTGFLWAECYCCVAFRWATAGLLAGMAIGLVF